MLENVKKSEQFRRIFFALMLFSISFSLIVDLSAVSLIRDIPTGIDGFIMLINSGMKMVSIELIGVFGALPRLAYIITMSLAL